MNRHLIWLTALILFRRLVVLSSLLVSTCAFASDIAREVRVGATGPDTSNGGFLEIGASFELLNHHRVQEDPSSTDEIGAEIDLSISGAFSYRGLFAGFTEGSFDGFNIGYNFYAGQHWSYDLLLSSFNGALNVEYDKIGNGDSEAARDRKLLNRDTFYNGFGLRATRYFNDYVAQFRLVADVHGGNGYQASARIGRHSQISNWNVHAVAGLVYDSSDLGQYLWGVSSDEATERFPEHQVDDGVRFQFEAGGLYPLSRDWVFRTMLRYTLFPPDVVDSPLINHSFSLSVGGSINYVF